MAVDAGRALALELAPFSVEIERGRLRSFAAAIGETDPIYADRAAATAAGHRDVLMPPTYLFSIDLEAPDPFGYLEDLGIDLSTVLHGEQSFDYHQPVYAGDVVEVTQKIVEVTAKSPTHGLPAQALGVPPRRRAGRRGRVAGHHPERWGPMTTTVEAGSAPRAAGPPPDHPHHSGAVRRRLGRPQPDPHRPRRRPGSRHGGRVRARHAVHGLPRPPAHRLGPAGTTALVPGPVRRHHPRPRSADLPRRPSARSTTASRPSTSRSSSPTAPVTLTGDRRQIRVN